MPCTYFKNIKNVFLLKNDCSLVSITVLKKEAILIMLIYCQIFNSTTRKIYLNALHASYIDDT